MSSCASHSLFLFFNSMSSTGGELAGALRSLVCEPCPGAAAQRMPRPTPAGHTHTGALSGQGETGWTREGVRPSGNLEVFSRGNKSRALATQSWRMIAFLLYSPILSVL